MGTNRGSSLSFTRLSELEDFLAFVALDAPDFLPRHQLTLDAAFADLDTGFDALSRVLGGEAGVQYAKQGARETSPRTSVAAIALCLPSELKR